MFVTKREVFGSTYNFQSNNELEVPSLIVHQQKRKESLFCFNISKNQTVVKD